MEIDYIRLGKAELLCLNRNGGGLLPLPPEVSLALCAILQ